MHLSIVSVLHACYCWSSAQRKVEPVAVQTGGAVRVGCAQLLQRLLQLLGAPQLKHRRALQCARRGPARPLGSAVRLLVGSGVMDAGRRRRTPHSCAGKARPVDSAGRGYIADTARSPPMQDVASERMSYRLRRHTARHTTAPLTVGAVAVVCW